VIRLFRSLPYKPDAQVLGKQLLRCGTSVAANYRAVCRSRSKAEFVARIGVVAEEADEAVLWLELMTESGMVSREKNEGIPGGGARADGNIHGIATDGPKRSLV
jgi:four helix bundle protein